MCANKMQMASTCTFFIVEVILAAIALSPNNSEALVFPISTVLAGLPYLAAYIQTSIPQQQPFTVLAD